MTDAARSSGRGAGRRQAIDRYFHETTANGANSLEPVYW